MCVIYLLVRYLNDTMIKYTNVSHWSFRSYGFIYMYGLDLYHVFAVITHRHVYEHRIWYRVLSSSFPIVNHLSRFFCFSSFDKSAKYIMHATPHMLQPHKESRLRSLTVLWSYAASIENLFSPYSHHCAWTLLSTVDGDWNFSTRP